jgi:hypothetical protein
VSNEREKLPGSDREAEHEDEQQEHGPLEGPQGLMRRAMAMRHQQRIHRKKADGGGDKADAEHEVSQPGDAAEQEADAVSDHVAGELHGDGDKGGDKPHAGKEQAPAIGAKLKDGAISLSGKKGANPNQLPLPGMGGDKAGGKDDKKKDPAKPKRDPKDPVFLKAKAVAAPAAAQLQAALEPNQKGRVAMGAGVTESGGLIVATSEGGLRPTVAQAFKTMGAELAKGSAGVHAEDKIIAKGGKSLVAVAAGIPICEECEDHILTAGALPASRCRSGKVY